jgi:Cu-Zn family superoxide dismutase
MEEGSEQSGPFFVAPQTRFADHLREARLEDTMKSQNFLPLPMVMLAATALMASACVSAAPAKHDHHDHPAPLASAVLKGADGATKGKAWIAGSDGHWELKVEVEGLAAGTHGIHLHTVGACDAPDFTTAGGHLNPQGKQHGSDNPQGAHLGDLPNLTVGADGKGMLSIHLPGTTATLAPALFDADGAAVVVHAAADDYRTDPSGNSGARIACGVLTRTP